jgi:glucosamine-6-phosphate deaminase
VIAAADGVEIGRVTASLVADNDPAVIGVATGSSPITTYLELVRRRSLRDDVQLCLLDEYIGLPVGHPRRYRSVVTEQLARPLGLGDDHLHGPDVDAPDLVAATRRYEEDLSRLGGVDVQILGIGRNGHIGFNEPGTPFDSRTHVGVLTETTRHDNARFFADLDHVPHRVITQGLGTIAAARRIVLIASGPAKCDAITALLSGPATTDLPASALLDHPDVTIIGDQAALAGVLDHTTFEETS